MKARTRNLSEREHRMRHERLHRSLDELVADWISQQSVDVPWKGLEKTSIMDLIKWSHEQTIQPTKPTT